MVATVQAGTGPAVVRVAREHAELLAEFYRKTWDENATRAGVLLSRALRARTNLHGRDQDVPTFVFIDNERIVGHLTTIPILLWNGREELRAHWLKGLMVLPEYRNGPVGFMLVRAALAAVENALAAVVATDARRLFTALGFRDLGVLANRIRVFDAREVIQRLADSPLAQQLSPRVRAVLRWTAHPGCIPFVSAALQAGAGAYTAVRGRTRQCGRIMPVFPESAELHELWRAMRSGIDCAPARGPDYLVQRYGLGQGYRWITVHRNGRLRGFAALRPPTARGDERLNGVRVATLSDVIANTDDSETLLDLVHTAEQVARGLDAHVLMCSASHPRLLRILDRRAFAPYPGNVHMLIRPNGADWPGIDHWWFTRGDSAADEAF